MRHRTGPAAPTRSAPGCQGRVNVLVRAAKDVSRGVSAGPASGFGGEVTQHAKELRTVSAENVVGLVIAVSLVGYLVLARLFPERF